MTGPGGWNVIGPGLTLDWLPGGLSLQYSLMRGDPNQFFEIKYQSWEISSLCASLSLG